MSTKSKKGAKWAIASLRSIARARADAGELSQQDIAQLELNIAMFKERQKTNRLLGKIARRLKKR